MQQKEIVLILEKKIRTNEANSVIIKINLKGIFEKMQFIQNQTDSKNQDEEWNVIYSTKKIGKISLQQVVTFPLEWFFKTSKFTLSQLEEIIKFVKEFIKSKKGEWLLYKVDSLNTDEELLKKLLKIGFTHYMTSIYSFLDLSQFHKPDPELNSIIIESWLDSSLGGTYSESTRKRWDQLYKLECTTSDDIPDRIGFKHPSFDQYVARFNSGEVSIESLFIAREKDNLVGITYALTDDTTAEIFYTGVDQSYRNKGIATALKIKLAEHLKSKGYKKLITKNKDNNYSILSTNEKIGFKIDSRITLYRLKI